jgi:hypothetical protein
MAKLDWASEVFYRRLHSVVDDFGRYYADPGLLRAACYPRQLGKVSDSDIVKWTRCAVETGLVRVYEVAGESYLELLDFRQHVRAKESKYPPPPSACSADVVQLQSKREASAPVFGDVFEDVSGVGVETRADARGARLHLKALPEDWKAFCLQERADLNPEETFKRFRDYWIAQPGQKGVKTDWEATWRNWVRKEDRGRNAAPDYSAVIANLKD